MTFRTFLVVTILFFIYSGVQAQEGSLPENDLKRAVVFGFNGLNISDFMGGVGYKTWIGSNSAVVLGVEFGYSESSEDSPEDDEYHPDSNSSRDRIGIYAEYQKHFSNENSLSPYTGIALQTGWSGSSSSRTYPEQSDIPNSKRTSDMFSITPGILLGFEYFLKSDISLSAQSYLNAAFSWGSDETNDGTNITEIDRSEFNLTLGTSRLLLIVYF